MAKEVFVPKLGQTMEEATIARWLVANGDRVEPGREILEVETDKALFTVEATGRGVIHLGPFQPGDVVPVLTVVAIIGKPEDQFVATGAAAAPSLPVPALETTAGTGPSQSPQEKGIAFASPRARRLADSKGVDLTQVTPTGGGGQRVAERDVLAYLSQLPKVTPVAQRVAADAGLDLRSVTGTGPGGKITREDVERAVRGAIQPAAPAEAAGAPSSPVVSPASIEVLERLPLKGVRAIIAERMATSAHTTAQVTLLMEVDATELVAMRERLKARVEQAWGFVPGYNDLLAKIVALALREFPYMNARLLPDAVERLAHVNLGLAVDTERGLLVPVVRDADQKSLRQLGQESRELVERARTGRSLPDDLSGGTFTITNLGMYDVMAFTPLINLPEAAILGVGNITPQPVARDDQVAIRKLMYLSLAFDHRLVDGAPAARFLQHIKNVIEEPYLLLAA